MARSYRHKPITGWTSAQSEKTDKQKANRRFRLLSKRTVLSDISPHVKESSNVYFWDKDGKCIWYGEPFHDILKAMRK